MKSIPLLPRCFQWIGLLLVLTSLLSKQIANLNFSLFAVLSNQGNFRFINTDAGLTIFLTTSILGLLFISFTKRKQEDEMINSLRLFSWSWSIIISFISFLLITVFVYDSDYLIVMYFPHLILGLFLILFNIQLFKIGRRVGHEE
ncbi:hypothetical protein E2P86_05020 [Sphingobacterium psychroaquaticum]|uniref:Uncharacterized protein n=1 Tax=Sphingobacterium psychroaquaticum TaxID=561061 RepID=A0A1X7KPA2_9SPHI|nr:hypothetical protein [Sphingobacterium psychroaquaticum]QBQ40546.1 hypothetical protein E2P86_05020 [Sphingobacterium psychroaquaticum]SMG43398.1 hypothetical protein SAMN05660862_3091 [Sphingobacterium psychroaquaticum]